jgi:hypothetical protein
MSVADQAAPFAYAGWGPPENFCDIFFRKTETRATLHLVMTHACNTVHARRRELPQTKIFLSPGSPITPWKGSFPPRKSKEIQAFFLDKFCPGAAGLGSIRHCFGI